MSLRFTLRSGWYTVEGRLQGRTSPSEECVQLCGKSGVATCERQACGQLVVSHVLLKKSNFHFIARAYTVIRKIESWCSAHVHKYVSVRFLNPVNSLEERFY